MKSKLVSAQFCAHPKNLLKGLLLAGLVTLTTIGAAQAQTRKVIDFESVQNVVSPTLNAGSTAYNTGDAFRAAGFTARVTNPVGVDPADISPLGVLINGSNDFACMVIACPSGNESMYFGGLNDGSLNLSRDDGLTFMVDGLRFAFIAPVPGLPDGSYGQLQLTGFMADGTSTTFRRNFAGQDASGGFVFDDFALSNLAFSSVRINACVYGADGLCSDDHFNVAQNQAQFAIDDIRLGVVPEPASAALMLLGLAGMTLVARRRSK